MGAYYVHEISRKCILCSVQPHLGRANATCRRPVMDEHAQSQRALATPAATSRVLTRQRLQGRLRGTSGSRGLARSTGTSSRRQSSPLLLAALESCKCPALSCPLSACVAPATVTEKDTVPLPDRGPRRQDPEETNRRRAACYLRGEGFQLLTQAHSVYCRL